MTLHDISTEIHKCLETIMIELSTGSYNGSQLEIKLGL